MMANPTAFSIGVAQPQPQPSALSLASTVPGGGLEVINLKTKPGAYVSMIVTFPQSRPLVIGPVHAPSTGQWSYSFTVPQSDRGIAMVVVVAGGKVLQGTFTIQ